MYIFIFLQKISNSCNDYIVMRNDDTGPVRKIEWVIHKAKKSAYMGHVHKHDNGEFIYVDYGSTNLRLGNRHLELKTGECIFISSGRIHAVSERAGAAYDMLNILYHGILPRRFTNTVIALNPDERRALAMVKEEKLANGLYGSFMILAYFNQFVIHLARRRNKPVNGHAAPENRVLYCRDVAAKAIDYLRQHHARPLDAAAAARYAGVSTSYLRFLLKKQTGHGLRRHLQEIRIEMAKRLLRSSSGHVEHVAWKIGYRSAPHFINMFKKHTGMTPLQYARSLGDPETQE